VSSQFEVELAKLIADEKARITVILASGKVKDYPEYKHWAGQLMALDLVTDSYFAEAQSIVDKR
jgi:hypothetical protein